MYRFFRMIYFPAFLLLASPSVQAQELRTMTTESFLQEMEEIEEGTVLINFWATWCGPCVEELPSFNQLAREHASEGLKVIFVSLDFNEAPLVNFLETHEFEGEVIFLSNGLRDPDWIEEMDPAWSGAIPATLAINYETEARAFHEGSLTYKALIEWLSPAFVANN